MSLLGLLALVLACSPKGGPAATGDDTQGVDSDDGAVTWYGDVEPIVASHCWRCHNPDGVGPGDWTDYAQAKDMADLIAAYTASGEMPPPSADPSCRSYQGDEGTTLSADDIATIGAWEAAGAPEGDPADAVAKPSSYEQHLTDADLTLTVPFEYTLDLDEDGNEYRCFVIPHDQAEPFYVTAFDADVGNPKVVHHLFLFKTSDANPAAAYGVTDTSNGWPCRNPIFPGSYTPLHAWAPGMPPTELPEGTGIEVDPDETLVLQMHYYGTPGEHETDQSSYHLRTASEVDRPVLMYPVGPSDFTVPAGDADYSVHYGGTNDYGVTIEAFGMFPHMHLLGKAYDATITHADGSQECLVHSDRWDFHNQSTYMWNDPAVFAPGDSIDFSCAWDNSADNPAQYNDPPQDIPYGEGTNQEMCFFLTYMALAL